MAEIESSLYLEMCKIRHAENIIRREYGKDQIRTPVHLCLGAEAIAVGVLSEISQPRIYGTYRNHHWYLGATQDYAGFWAELYAKEGAPGGGRAGSMHLAHPERGYILSSAVVASTIPLAVGDAWATKDSAQTLCFFGDGATEEGVFWESLNMAALKKTPLLFVCEDNGYSIHTPRHKRQSYDLAAVVKACGIPYFSGSGADVLQVKERAREAKAALRSGPAFLHFKYERLLEHVGISSDYEDGYRSAPRDKEWDPLVFSQNRLKEKAPGVEGQAEKFVEESWRQAMALKDLSSQNVRRHLFQEAKK